MNNLTKHTPRPWIIKQHNPLLLSFSLEIEEMTNGVESSISQEEAEVNRILMQSAPELLEENESLKDHLLVANNAYESLKKDLRTTTDCWEHEMAVNKSLHTKLSELEAINKELLEFIEKVSLTHLDGNPYDLIKEAGRIIAKTKTI